MLVLNNQVKSFKKYFVEQNVAGPGGVFGSAPSMDVGGAVGNSDSYASGDSRLPYVIGMFSRSGKRRKKKKKSK